jgi:SAM-dependent methyltransferase
MSGAESDPRRRFTATATDYHRHRPSYPDTLVDWVLALLEGRGPPRIADLGCGTGISTRQFAPRASRMVGVEPNEQMLGFARAAGGPEYRQGEATATGLPDRSVDLVIAAQAFHWFPLEATVVELARILAPEGWCAAFWNVRAAESTVAGAYDELLRRFVLAYDRRPKAGPTIEAIRRAAGVRQIREAAFPNVQSLDQQGLLGRAHSSSYVAHDVARPGELDQGLRALFSAHQINGRVELAYRTVVIAWQLAPPP